MITKSKFKETPTFQEKRLFPCRKIFVLSLHKMLIICCAALIIHLENKLVLQSQRYHGLFPVQFN